MILEQATLDEAKKLIRRFENYARQLADEYQRRSRRPRRVLFHDSLLSVRTIGPWPRALTPTWCGPTRTVLHIRYGARCPIERMCHLPLSSTLFPRQAGGGGKFAFSRSPIALFLESFTEELMEKNRSRMSSRAYAYRDDLSAQDAIQYVAAEMRGQSRVFVAEYDFSKYFDNISHDYLQKILRDRQFLLSRAEKRVVDAFLCATPVPADRYQSSGGARRERGIPQGTSISLFLANVAAWELDRSLERLGVSFVRYADDTLIWSTDYAQLCRAVDALHEIAARIGSPDQLRKIRWDSSISAGGAPSELPGWAFIEYLGHKITASSVGMKERVVRRIKERVNDLLYFNLIREPELGTQHPDRLQRVDRDYVTYVWQVRRYLYGDISERRLRRFQARGVPRRRFRGVMSFFPLLDDDQQLEIETHGSCARR